MRIAKTGHGRPLLGTLAVGLTLACSLQACGSASQNASDTPANSSATTRGIAQAKANLAKYESVSAPQMPGSPFDASAAKSEVVELVMQKGANPAVASVAASVKTALKHEGVVVHTCDAQGISVDISNCIRQGIAQGAKAVIVDGGDPSSYSAGLKDAQGAGVPLVTTIDVPLPSEITAAGADPSQAVSKLKGLAFDAAPPDALSGTLMADYITVMSKGKGSGLLITSPGIVGSDYLQKAFDVELAKTCPSCHFDTKGVVITNWAADLSSTVSAYLAQHPDAGYIVPVFDPMTAYTDPAIRSAGKAASVKVVTANGSLQQMEELKQGGVLTADAGQDLPELGFLAADQVLRLITGQKATSSGQAGALRFFTSSNIGSVDVTPNASTTGEWFTGSADALSSAYYALWSGKSSS